MMVPFTFDGLLDIAPYRQELLVAGPPVSLFYGGGLWSLPVPGGQPRRLGNMQVYDAAWSPDGATLYYSSHGLSMLPTRRETRRVSWSRLPAIHSGFACRRTIAFSASAWPTGPREPAHCGKCDRTVRIFTGFCRGLPPSPATAAAAGRRTASTTFFRRPETMSRRFGRCARGTTGGIASATLRSSSRRVLSMRRGHCPAGTGGRSFS
jgi:hypothetical protein